LRTMARSPMFTAVAVFSLALGIGANTAIFTLMDQLLLRLLPVKDPQQLVMIWSSGPHLGNNNGGRASSYPMYQQYQRRAPFLSHVFARYQSQASVSFAGQTERISLELISGNYFQTLGVGPAAGRVFTPEEDDRTYQGHPVAVLSYDYWMTRFSGKRDVLGTKILVNNYPMTVVGVSAPGFQGLDPAFSPQVRVPIQMKPLMTPAWDDLGNERSQWIQLFARMKPGETVDSARGKLQNVFRQVLEEEIKMPGMRTVSAYYLDLFRKRQVKMELASTGYSGMRNQVGDALVVLMGMVGLVLLISCANVANLLIARAAARQKELAVRMAIGSSRAQLVRQLLIESLVLAFSGAALGVILSMWTVRALMSFAPAGASALTVQATPDTRVLAFTIGLAFLTSLIFGLLPAMQSTRLNLWTTLKDMVGGIAGGFSGVRLRKALVAAQVAFSFLLLAGAGLFMRSLSNLQSTETGFKAMSNLVTFQVNPALNGYNVPREKLFYRQLLANVRAAPGVQDAAIARVALLHGNESDSCTSVEGHTAKDGEDMQAFTNSLSPGYFTTMGIPLLEGRDFLDSDAGEVTSVAIVNRKFAEHFFGSVRNAIGRYLGQGCSPQTKLTVRIVGVTENTLYEGPRDGVHRQAFFPRFQARNPGSVAFYAHTGIGSVQTYSLLRNEVRKLDSALPVYELKTLQGQLDETLSAERLIATLSGAFGVLATLLAAIGLYGVMAFVVVRRTKEIGLRVALGAQPSQVLWIVMREVLLLLGIGLAAGVPIAYLLTRVVSSQLYNVQPADLPTAVIAASLLGAVALAAGFLPARRATTIDPMRALRYE